MSSAHLNLTSLGPGSEARTRDSDSESPPAGIAGVRVMDKWRLRALSGLVTAHRRADSESRGSLRRASPVGFTAGETDWPQPPSHRDSDSPSDARTRARDIDGSVSTSRQPSTVLKPRVMAARGAREEEQGMGEEGCGGEGRRSGRTTGTRR